MDKNTDSIPNAEVGIPPEVLEAFIQWRKTKDKRFFDAYLNSKWFANFTTFLLIIFFWMLFHVGFSFLTFNSGSAKYPFFQQVSLAAAVGFVLVYWVTHHYLFPKSALLYYRLSLCKCDMLSNRGLREPEIYLTRLAISTAENVELSGIYNLPVPETLVLYGHKHTPPDVACRNYPFILLLEPRNRKKILEEFFYDASTNQFVDSSALLSISYSPPTSD